MAGGCPVKLLVLNSAPKKISRPHKNKNQSIGEREIFHVCISSEFARKIALYLLFSCIAKPTKDVQEFYDALWRNQPRWFLISSKQSPFVCIFLNPSEYNLVKTLTEN